MEMQIQLIEKLLSAVKNRKEELSPSFREGENPTISKVERKETEKIEIS